MDAKPGGMRSGAARPSVRHRVYRILEAGAHADGTARAIEIFMVVLILGNVVAFALETVPAIEARHGPLLRFFNALSIGIFALEYGARLWVAPEHPINHGVSPGQARLRHALTPLMIVDFLVIAPYALFLIFPIDLRALRLVCLLRFLKLVRYSPALSTLADVVAAEWRALAGAGVVMAGVLLGSSALLYTAEGEAQPASFGTLPDAMWWAVATLTTVGYGDVVPVTALGKLIGAVVMIMGLAFFALPVGIIATGFSQQIHRRDFMVNWGLVARLPLFQGLDPRDLAGIIALVHARVVPAGCVLVHGAAPSDGLYIVSSGEVELTGADGRALLGEGDWFGAVAGTAGDAGATAVTVSKCHVLHIDGEDFDALLGRNPALATRLSQSGIGRD